MNENSQAAYAVSDRKAQAEEIFQHILDAPDGLTVDECRQVMGDVAANSTVAARFSYLKKVGRIVAIGNRLTRSDCSAGVYFPTKQEGQSCQNNTALTADQN